MTTLVCLGDSITQGEGDTDNLGWVGRLNRFLAQRHACHYTVHNLGISGQILKELHHRYHTECLIRRPDIVLIAGGTNDCQRHDDPQHPLITSPYQQFAVWRKWAKDLLHARHRTFILGVTPAHALYMPYTFEGEPKTWILREDLQDYNARLQEFAQQHHIPFIDFWPSWHDLSLTDYTVDGVHPNADGYEKMAHTIIDALIQAQAI